ncbi:MAG TPA: DUF3108 domain-containing protein [Mariniphaga sp.]|nr:DUF3108 domain-containing protein [Mariniphaga sp.]
MKKIVIAVIFILSIVHVSVAAQEKIRFDLKFGFIKGGEARLIISDTIWNDVKARHFYIEGRTTGFTDKLFGVNDVYETIVDYDTGLPLKSIRNIKEGRYKWYNETMFHHQIDSIHSQKSGWRAVPEDLLDIVSVFFYFINNYLEDGIQQGLEVTFPTYHGDDINDVTVKYMGDQVIETNNGNVDCYILAPVVDKGKVLKRSDGLKFFVSKDTKLPILLEFDMRVGALRAEMQSYHVDGKEHVFR